MTRRAERHSLSDWLALHELDQAACRRILDAAAAGFASAPAAHSWSASKTAALNLEAAWLKTADAMRTFFPAERRLIDETFNNTVKRLVSKSNKSLRAFTLDHGPDTYPTIFYTYRGKPSDAVTIAHEFGHAVQIRASQGKFVSPIMREVCAFLSETALLHYALHSDVEQYCFLSQVWHADNERCFGPDRDRLNSALLQPETAYNYSWNYPIARYLAIRFSRQCSRDGMWTLFEGNVTVAGALRQLGFEPTLA